MKSLTWRPAALTDVAGIKAYIARDNPVAAQRVVDRVVKSVKKLARLPKMGRPGEVEGTREFLVQPWKYILVYRDLPDSVEVIGVFHGAQSRATIVKRRQS